ncbi:hypothetical protein ACEWY4_020299 [Coilia grayii]|uniref:TNFR-Cys domain-containing protein n=1 Tax=Coilia grayii TaxID=363190 RepID=A0ABD1JDE1_9TELE
MGGRLLFKALLILLAKGAMLEDCKICEPGSFLQSCKICAACPSGSYTSRRNRERQCHPCSKDCTAEFNLEEVEACSTKADVACRCKAGYSCTSTDSLTKRCLRCEKDSTAEVTAVTAVNVIRTTKMSPQNRAHFAPTRFRQQTAGKATHSSTDAPVQTGNGEGPAVAGASPQWLVVLVVGIGLFALLVVLALYGGCGDALCLRKFMKKRFPSSDKGSMKEVTPRGPMAAVHSKESHPDSLPAASHDQTPASSLPGTLGPLYIQQPSAVFVSLLNQFGFGGGEGGGGAGGGGGGGGCDEESQQAEHGGPKPEGGDEGGGPSPPSPLPLSTEERSRDEDICIPFQEQGKESHMSKEEEL